MPNIHPSKEFPALGFLYDPGTDPFFKALVKENLRKLQMLPTGKALLKVIAKAKPAKKDQ